MARDKPEDRDAYVRRPRLKSQAELPPIMLSTTGEKFYPYGSKVVNYGSGVELVVGKTRADLTIKPPNYEDTRDMRNQEELGKEILAERAKERADGNGRHYTTEHDKVIYPTD